MSILPKEAKTYIGVRSKPEFACDHVEEGAVRRYAQAIMDDDPIYSSASADNHFGGPVAPPLFPAHMFRRPFGSEDAVQANANNPDFDGAGVSTTQGLPPVKPLEDWTLLNGGLEVEFFRYARVGERVQVQSRYLDIQERETRTGSMVLVIQENEYRTDTDELLLRVRRTHIRRPR
jgi:acyl dehydratase